MTESSSRSGTCRHGSGSPTRVTPEGADAGIDVVATNAAAQVKHYADKLVGAPEVQQARGAAFSAKHVLFYTLSGYTPAALKAANNAKVCLFTYTVYGDVSAANPAAGALLSNARRSREMAAPRPRTPQEAEAARTQSTGSPQAVIERERRRQERLKEDREEPERRRAAAEQWKAEQERVLAAHEAAEEAEAAAATAVSP